MANASKLRDRADFRRVVRGGSRISGARMTVYWLQSSEEIRAGFVARRDVGGAVVRNRSRRVLREAWRQVAPSVSKPIDVVFLARPGMAQSKMPEVAKEMRELLARQRVIGR